MTDMTFSTATNPAKGSLLASMAIDIAVNERSEVVVMHDRAFDFAVDHLEFHQKSGELFFSGNDNVLHPFGMKVPRKTRAKLAGATAAHLFQITLEPERKIEGHAEVPVAQKE